jgi:hypothetical protein
MRFVWSYTQYYPKTTHKTLIAFFGFIWSYRKMRTKTQQWFSKWADALARYRLESKAGNSAAITPRLGGFVVEWWEDLR